MNPSLQAFRAVDFNWTYDLQGVWSDPAFQVHELHSALIDCIMDDFLLRTKKLADNPLGR
jgi:hypothetical protein